MVGAGFGNMIFLSAGATVIQLIPGVTHPRLPCGLTPWWHIAELMHLPVRSFVIEQARFDQTTPVEMPMQEFATFIQKIKGTVQVRRPQW
jgi:hypothetical protein